MWKNTKQRNKLTEHREKFTKEHPAGQDDIKTPEFYQNLIESLTYKSNVRDKKIAFIVVAHFLHTLPYFLEALSSLGEIAALISKRSGVLKNVKKTIMSIYEDIIFKEINKENLCENKEIAEIFFTDIINNKKWTDYQFVILDHGGYFAPCIFDVLPKFKEKLIGIVEHTWNGEVRYSEQQQECFANNFPIPVKSIAHSELKGLESDSVARSIIDAITVKIGGEGLNQDINRLKKILIIGFGNIGKSIVKILRARIGKEKIYICDTSQQAFNEAESFVLPLHRTKDKQEFLKDADLIITATSAKVLTSDDFSILKSGAIVACATSSDDQFAKDALKDYNICLPRKITETKSELTIINSTETRNESLAKAIRKQPCVKYQHKERKEQIFYLFANGDTANFLIGSTPNPIMQLILAAIYVSAFRLLDNVNLSLNQIHLSSEEDDGLIKQCWEKTYGAISKDWLSEVISKLKNKFEMSILKETDLKPYIEPLGITSSNDTPASMWEAVKSFITHPTQQSFLLFADPGMGKTLFARWITRQLWKECQSTHQQQYYLPLYIYLPSLVDNNGSLAKEFLKNFLKNYCGLKKDEINELKENKIPLLLILDGFDEIQWPGNIFKYLEHYQNIKLLCTCRLDVLIKNQNYDQDFYWRSTDRKNHLSIDKLLVKKELCPFNAEQIQRYVQKHLISLTKQEAYNLKQEWLEIKTYINVIENVSSLKELAQIPLILKMIVQVLPQVMEGKEYKDNSLMRTTLYYYFSEAWFERAVMRLRDEENTYSGVFRGDDRLSGNLKQYIRTYAWNLALSRLKEGKLQVIINEKESLGKALLIPNYNDALKSSYIDDQVTLEKKIHIKAIRSACLLKVENDSFQFLHKTFLEFFTAEAFKADIIKLIKNFKEPQQRLQICQQQLIIDESQVIIFLVEMAQSNSTFKAALWQCILHSKKHKCYATVAANAITIWSRAGFNLAGEDLSDVQIPGADLSHAVLAFTDFQNANLTDVRLQASNLCQTNLQEANLTNVQLGQLPYLQLDIPFEFCTFSPDGHSFVIADSIGYLHIFETHTWQLVRKIYCILEKPIIYWKPGITSLSWQPDSIYLAVGCNDGTIFVWNMQTYEPYQAISGYNSAICCLDFSSDGNLLAAGDDNKTVYLWQTTKTQDNLDLQLSQLEFDIAMLKAETLENTSQKISTPWKSYNLLGVLVGHTGRINSVCFINGGKILASASDDTTICLWNTETYELITVLKGHTTAVHSLSYTSLTNLLASGSHDTLQLWDTDNFQPITSFEGPELYPLIFGPNGKWLACASRVNIQLIDFANQLKTYQLFREREHSINCLSFSPNGKILATGTGKHSVMNRPLSPKIRLWEMSAYANSSMSAYPNSSMFDKQNEVRFDEIFDISTFSKNGKLFARSKDKTIYIRDTETHQLCGTLEKHTARITCMNFSYDGKLFASGDADSAIYLWSTHNYEFLGMLKQKHIWLSRLSFICFLDDRKWLASANDFYIHVWNTETCELVEVIENYRNIISINNITDKKLLIATKKINCSLPDTITLNSIEIKNIQSGFLISEERNIFCVEGNKSASIVGNNKVTVSFDGKLLAIDIYPNIQIYDIKTWGLLHTLNNKSTYGEKPSIRCMSFSSDGKLLAVVHWDAPTVFLWDIANGVCVSALSIFEIYNYPITCNFIHIIQTMNRLELNDLQIHYDNGSYLTLRWQPQIKRWKFIQGNLQPLSIKLTARNMQIDKSFGLSEINFRVLEQHGAVGKPVPIEPLLPTSGKFSFFANKNLDNPLPQPQIKKIKQNQQLDYCGRSVVKNSIKNLRSNISALKLEQKQDKPYNLLNNNILFPPKKIEKNNMPPKMQAKKLAAKKLFPV